MSDSFDITYAAHTAACTFLLDSEGVCRRIVPGTKRDLSAKGRDAARFAARCVGAQYVASLDPTVTGMLAELPRVGAAMLFACVDERGRVSLVRACLVSQFERYSEDPFAETERVPSTSVQTSAPMIAPSPAAERMMRSTAPPPPDVYEEEASDRTQPIHALRPAALRDLHRASSPPPPPAPEPLGDDDATLERTSEYASRPAARFSGGAPRRNHWPSSGVDLAPPPSTVRQPNVPVPAPAESDAYATPGRSVLPARRSEPHAVRPRTQPTVRPLDPARATRPLGYSPVVASGRGRGDR